MIRTELRFQTLDEIKSDIENLQRTGYSAHGKWDLSQICEHLADWMTYPLDGFPPMPWFVRVLIGAMRILRGKALYRQFVASQRMANNSPTAPQSVHKPNSDATASVQRLTKAIDRLKSHRGDIHPSPLFGALTKDELIALQMAHCAHHLRFLVPNQ
jgi:hypothetical protein